MSRTYKDRPDWVQLNEPSPLLKAIRRPLHVQPCDGICELDEPMTEEDLETRRCRYYLPFRLYLRKATPQLRRDFFWGPVRSEERESLRNMKNQYNAGLDVDDAVLTERHGHAMYGGGYWN